MELTDREKRLIIGALDYFVQELDEGVDLRIDDVRPEAEELEDLLERFRPIKGALYKCRCEGCTRSRRGEHVRMWL
jgi:hypothetical protein